MKLFVSAIVEVSVDKIALSICVGVDDWTAQSAIIASYAVKLLIVNYGILLIR